MQYFLMPLGRVISCDRPAGSIYASPEELQSSSRLSIAGGASVVDGNTSGTMTGRCCTAVGGGGGLEEVCFGPE